MAPAVVLTAAHCVDLYSPSLVQVLAGYQELFGGCDVVGQVDGMVVHPGWDRSDIIAGNDMAVLKLAAPLPLTERISPVCLPPSGPPANEDLVYTAGWGLTSFPGNISSVLMEVHTFLMGIHAHKWGRKFASFLVKILFL